MKKPRTYEATKARWADPASREAARQRMKEFHRIVKAVKEQEIGRKKQDKTETQGR